MGPHVSLQVGTGCIATCKKNSISKQHILARKQATLRVLHDPEQESPNPINACAAMRGALMLARSF
jgi:hypothetical protein